MGVIHLEGQSDHSGIIVAVYELAYLDTTIVRINNEYPHIGVIINQHTEFDHRFQSPVKFTETDIEGNFLIKKIPVGEYNIVALRDNFGFKYIYEIDIEKGDYDLTQQVTLYEEQCLYGDIEDNWIFETDHHYIIGEEGSNSTNFTPGTNLEIQPGAIIRIEPDNDLIIHGTISAQGEEDNMFWVTSNEGFVETLEQNYIDSTNYYNNFELSPYSIVVDDIIEWGKFDLANIGLLNQVNNLHMQNGIFRDSECGFYSINVDSTFCSNLSSKTITNESKAGIYFNQVSNGLIEKNVIINCKIGIKTKNTSSPNIENNFLQNVSYNIWISWYSLPIIQYNEIRNENSIGIYDHRSYEVVQYNNFSNKIGIIYDECYPEIPEIHDNNFNCSLYAIKIRNTIYYTADIDAGSNYFGTTNFIEINNLIWDKSDLEENDPTYPFTGIVLFDPYLIEDYHTAGIQGE